MCTWMTELPTQSKNGETPKKPNLSLYIKPTPPKEYYRFRLLGFKSAKSDRDFPWVTRFLHTVWVEDSDGKRHTDNVVCPVTPFVKAKWNGDPINDCPICKFANANFVAWKQSGWKDRESAKKNREFGRKFEACIPVYVVNDPVYQQNNGHFRVFTFTDKDQYKQFTDLVRETSQKAVVFNGKNALDFYIRYETVEEVLRPGQPNECVWKHPVLKQMGFTTKPYDIPAITKEAIDNFAFDEIYYIGSTMGELEDFYNRHVKISNDDIPDDDIQIGSIPTVQTTRTVERTNTIEKSEVVAETPKSNDVSTEEIDDLLDDGPVEEAKNPVVTKKEEPVKEESKDDILESPKDPLHTETSEEDLDDLLKDIL